VTRSYGLGAYKSDGPTRLLAAGQQPISTK
jgi:hypothetical protein